MIPRTKREYLRQLVDAKNKSFRPLTDEEKALGFLGWHERGYLPHCDYPGLIQFVTFRLGDSMPASRRGEWEHLFKIEDVREKRTKLEEYLDRGVGECHLRNARIAKLTEEALLHFHNERYELQAWCVMPNRARAGARVADAVGPDDSKLETIRGYTRPAIDSIGAPNSDSARFGCEPQRAESEFGAPIVLAARILGHVYAG